MPANTPTCATGTPTLSTIQSSRPHSARWQGNGGLTQPHWSGKERQRMMSKFDSTIDWLQRQRANTARAYADLQSGQTSLMAGTSQPSGSLGMGASSNAIAA